MWGKALQARTAEKQGGITPTHVGKRIKPLTIPQRYQDHPHPCGEKLFPIADFPKAAGSPPPMWGKDHCLGVLLVPVGITPTHVGKSPNNF